MSTSRRTVLILLAAAAVVLVAGCQAAPEISQPTPSIAVPPPHIGPGAPDVARDTSRKLDRVWNQIRTGQLRAARAAATELGGPTAELLELQLDLLDDGEPGLDRATHLAEAHPEWAAAWVTTSVVAERVGDEPMALSAARKAAKLWPRERWQKRASELARRWISERLDSAEQALAGDAFEAAVITTRKVLAIEPANSTAQQLLGRALLAQGDLEEASSVISSLPEGPDRTFLSARLLAQREEWLAAMQALETVPDAYPGRWELLSTVRTRWRRDNLPPHVQNALVSEQLSRSELAVVLAASAPQIKALPSDPPPLLTDIMEERGRDDILTVTALGLLQADRLEHLFHPARPVTKEEVRRGLTRLAVLLGSTPPAWCEPEATTPPCVSPPTTGPGVAALVEQIVNGE
jgi:tetratricopeptide (TPR) repeat protein